MGAGPYAGVHGQPLRVVEPNPDCVAVSRRNQDPEIPERVKKQLRDQAEREGGAVSTTNVVQLDHNLDTRETQTSQRRARSTTLNGDYAKMLEKMQDNQRAQKASKRRRGRARPDEKKGGYKLPELVVTIDTGGGGSRRLTRI